MCVGEVFLGLFKLGAIFRKVGIRLVAISGGLVDVGLVFGKRGVALFNFGFVVRISLVLFCLDIICEIIDHSDDYIHSSFKLKLQLDALAKSFTKVAALEGFHGC